MPAAQLTRRRLVVGLGAERILHPALAFARRHAWLIALLVAASALRVVALLAIWPGIWFSDSNPYVRAAATGTLSITRVAGYSLFVTPFYRLGSAGALIVTQHVIGLAIVAALYALLVRRGVSRPIAALAVAPAALDAYLIDLEHMIMSETVFHAALVAAVVVLLWSDRARVPPAAAAAAGLLLGYAGVVRSVAVPMVVLFVLYLLARRAGWRALAAFAVGWALVAGGYAAVFDAQHGHFGFTESGGRFLYAKVAPFASCARLHGVPASERALCPDPALHLTVNSALWGHRSPIHGLGVGADRRIRDFAMRVIRQRPGHYAGVVAQDFLHFFEPGHRIGHNDYPVTTWQFPSDPRAYDHGGYRGPIRPGVRHRLHGTDPSPIVNGMVGRPVTRVGPTRFLHAYQRFFYTSGELLAACVVLVLIAVGLRRGPWRLRLDAALLTASVLVALLVTAALSLFDYRYGLVAVILLPVAAAMAGTGLARREPAT